jgi:PAS domain S-box-containing protein
MTSIGRAAAGRDPGEHAAAPDSAPAGDPPAISSIADWESDIWRSAVDALPTAIAVLDEHGRIVAVNAAWTRYAELNGGSASEVGPGADYFGVCAAVADSEPFAAETLTALREILAGQRDLYVAEYACHSPTQRRWYALRATPYRVGGRSGITVMHTDITHRRRAEQLARSQAALLHEIDAAVISMDEEGRVIDWNGGAERMYGWTRTEVLGRDWRERIFPAAPGPDTEAFWKALGRAGSWRGDLTVSRRDGSSVVVSSRTVSLDSEVGEREGYVTVQTDVGDRLASEMRLRDAADYLRAVTNSVADGLFALDTSGRVTFVNDATVRLLGWPREQLIGEVMHELTHYRHADGTPHRFADCPIVQACRDDRPARVEDDIFVRYDGTDLPVAFTASPFHTGDGVGGAVVVFRDISEEKARRQRLQQVARDFRWAQRVREVLASPTVSRSFELYAQPIVSTQDRSLHCDELLLRMRRDGELVLPAKFLPAATRHDLMPEIDRWVVAEAIRIAATNRAVSINLSPRSFSDLDLLEEIERRRDAARVPPELLMFEVTETAVIDDDETARRFLARLRELGCKVALDDFGTGYAGFTYLKRLPLDYLKIDREFVRDLVRNESSRHVIDAVVNLAAMFGHRTVAEGVEDEETFALLREHGVDFAQGFLLGRPSPIVKPTTRLELVT